jgi:hypothetical protein
LSFFIGKGQINILIRKALEVQIITKETKQNKARPPAETE